MNERLTISDFIVTSPFVGMAKLHGSRADEKKRSGRTHKMCPSGLRSEIDKDRADYLVFCGEWKIGRIYEIRGGPDHLQWFCALHFLLASPEGQRIDNRVPSSWLRRRISRRADSSGRHGRRWRGWLSAASLPLRPFYSGPRSS